VDGKLFHPTCASKYWTKQAEEQRSKRSALPINNVLQDIVKPVKDLKHVDEVRDSSQPKIEPDVQVKKNVHSRVLEQVQKVELKELKHVDTDDKAKPQIEKVKVKKSKRPKMMNEIQTFQGFAAKKAEYEKQVENQNQVRTKVFEDIEKDHHKELKHVEKVNDTSSPQIDKDIHIKKNAHGQVFTELQKAEPTALKHVETKDNSAPVIDKDAKVKKSDARPALLKEIKSAPLSSSKLSGLLNAYEKNVEDSQKVGDTFKNREGQDVAELTGVAQRTKSAYAQNVDEANKLDGIHRNKEADVPVEVSGLSKKVKDQYLQDVAVRNQSQESTQLEKDGDKVVYKNLPPKKDLNDII